MMRGLAAWGLTAAVGALLAVAPAAAVEPDLGTEAQRQAGKVLYDKYCSQCHGDNGDGVGTATPRVKPKPRDFTSGKYKIRTTPSGFPPTTEDLVKVLRDGVPYTSMPAWPQLSEQELTELAYYLKTFSSTFADANSLAEPMDLPEPPEFTQESADLGRVIYQDYGCSLCHGELARGDGGSAPTLEDDWGDHIRVADLSKRWAFRGGPDRKDIFRAFTTAFNGTPMPSYADVLSVEERWHLTNYVWSLSPADDPEYDTMVAATKILREIDLDNLEDVFEAAAPARFPVIGQLIEPGREFFASALDIEVRAVYNDSDMAFELRWHDMRAETTGTNSPDLFVPRFENDPFRGGAPDDSGSPADDEDEEDDFWAEEEPAAEEDDFWAEESEEDDFWGDEGDETAEAAATPDTEFSDAVAVQLPSVLPAGSKKPYFILGDGQNPVDLWFMDLARDRPETFIARGSESIESQGTGELSSHASYDNGEWTVVFKRPLREGGVAVEEGLFVPVAFSVWDGFNRERGNKRGLTRWFSLYLEPGGEKSTRGPVFRAVLVTLALELVLIAVVRRRYRQSHA